jgi:release factor glutamine methyltransferase
MKQAINVISLIQEIEQHLSAVYADPILCRQYAWWTVEAILHKDKAALILDQTLAVTDAQKKTISDWTDKMVHEHMPIQYLLGSVPFNGVDILVKPPVLIPRPETEELTIDLINQLKKLSNQPLRILDLCTGSGCIALALAKHLPQATITATDISDAALELAQLNAQHNKIANVTFIQSDVYSALTTPFDLIVANPPYISTQEWQQLDASVSQWEDPIALVAEQEGLAIIKKIIDGARKFLRPNEQMQLSNMPQLIIEIGHRQGQAVMDLMQAAGFASVQVQKDLEGKDRVVKARVDHVATTKH